MKLHARPLLTCLGVTAAALIAPPAFAAAGPYVVTAGDQNSGTTDFVATADSFAFSAPNADLTCGSGTAGGTVTLGPNSTGEAIASIEETSFSDCTGPLGLRFAVTQDGPWSLNATGDPAGTTEGTIDQVAATVRSTSGPSCSFRVDGSVDGSFTEEGQSLDLGAPVRGARLSISEVRGCLGLVSDGQEATLETSYVVSAQAGPLSISAG